MVRIALFLIFTASIISCQPRFEKEITTLEIEDHIAYLASDELKGRYPGTPEEVLMGKYIASEFKNAGLVLYDKTGISLLIPFKESVGTSPIRSEIGLVDSPL